MTSEEVREKPAGENALQGENYSEENHNPEVRP